MTLSIWRYAHLILALISFIFLLILSITGTILAVDAVGEKATAYKVANFDTLNVAHVVSELNKVYPEIQELTVNHVGNVQIDAMDGEGNMVKGYIDPNNGQLLGPVQEKSEFIQWTTNLHRSLFLKETGRILVGVVSFILFLITISGIVLIAKRQNGFRHFFAKIKKDHWAQYFHVVSGRLSLIPILALAATGTYLLLMRLNILSTETVVQTHEVIEGPTLQVREFPVFKTTQLSEVEKIDFPFMPDDPEEFYKLKLRDKTITVNQITGQVVESEMTAIATIGEKFALDWHTGRTNIIWAILLGIASLNIVAFIYSGFVITFRRTRTKVSNPYTPEKAEYILLVGSENGSTTHFANEIHKQLLAAGKSSFLTTMNHFQNFPLAKHLLVFTCTYGKGTAPASANIFSEIVNQTPTTSAVKYAVVGFGSKSYPDFCAYAEEVDRLLNAQSWATQFLPMHTVNEKSPDEFVKWVHAWSEKALIPLATAPGIYATKKQQLVPLEIVKKTAVSETNATFTVCLKVPSKINYRSGDLLVIYPGNDHRERFYSIGKSTDGLMQLIVKLHTPGLGSEYLNNLVVGQTMRARVMINPEFHFPENAPQVLLIANGTGIAPFLGMITENKRHIPLHLMAGFRSKNEQTSWYNQLMKESIASGLLSDYQVAYSREQPAEYVMDLIHKNPQFVVDLLEQGGVIMICGSLNMLQDVELVIARYTEALADKPLSYYQDRHQILTDCY